MAPGAVTAYVALGSNLGGRAAYLEGAIVALRETAGVEVVAVSSVYETEPVGGPPQGPYLNAAVAIRTALPPRALLERLQEIEAAAGRTRGTLANAPRTLDLDILFYGALEISEPGLEVPHPRCHQRAFVLEPLREIAAEWVHPVLGETVEILAGRLRAGASSR